MLHGQACYSLINISVSLKPKPTTYTMEHMNDVCGVTFMSCFSSKMKCYFYAKENCSHWKNDSTCWQCSQCWMKQCLMHLESPLPLLGVPEEGNGL